MKLLREYIRELLAEDAIGFVQDLAASEDLTPDDSSGPRRGQTYIGKKGGRAIKRAFAKNADHQWLSTLDTVHWVPTPYSIEKLIGRGKDEISATMALPGGSLEPPIRDMPYGLWVKGRITLAANDMDILYTGHYNDYSDPHEGSEEEVQHRDRSSGRNKRPMLFKDYSRYAAAEKGNEEHEKIVSKAISYVLNKDTWQQPSPGEVNEALVDNWKPVGIIVADPQVTDIVSTLAYVTNAEEAKEELSGIVKKLILVALKASVPIYNDEKDVLWSPK